MKKQSPYTTRPGTTFSTDSSSFEQYLTKVIYYSASGGHFAKVVEYETNGYAKTLYSKWGYGERIKTVKTNNNNPFSIGSYGSETHYYR